MKSSTCIRMIICMVSLALTLFGYIEKQNELTELRLAIPILAKQVKDIEHENIQLFYEIENFQRPLHLEELKLKPTFTHLKKISLDDQMFLPKGKIKK